MEIIDRDFTFENLRELVSAQGVQWTAMLVCSDIFPDRDYNSDEVADEIVYLLGPELG